MLADVEVYDAVYGRGDACRGQTLFLSGAVLTDASALCDLEMLTSATAS